PVSATRVCNGGKLAAYSLIPSTVYSNCVSLLRYCMLLPTAEMVRVAADRLRDVVSRTPLIRSDALSAAAGTDVYLKCENLQRTGSFKLRGAYNALAT